MTKSSRRKGLSPKYGKFEHLEDRRLMALTTELAYDLNTTPGPAAVESLTVLGDAAYFLSGDTLWKTNQDGTATTEVKDFSGVDSFPSGKRMLLAGDQLFLFGKAGFWVSDGTEQGTIRIRDEFRPNPSAGFVYEADVNGTLFFVAANGASKPELWKSDGTPEGTANVPFSGSNPKPLGVVDDKLVFVSDSPELGRDLWVTDGTDAGTVALSDTAPSVTSTRRRSVNLGDKLLFSVFEEIWETDGTPAGTRELQEINRGSTQVIGASGGFAYFLADPNGAFPEIWRTDGSANGLTQIWTFDRDVHVESSVTIGDRIVFAVDSLDMQTWISDGTTEGTMQFHASDTTVGPMLTVVESEVFIAGRGGDNMPAIWKSDGTPEGTSLLRSFEQVTFVEAAIALNGAYLFDNGELRRSDGTPEGTGDIVHVNRNTLGSNGTTPLGFVSNDEFLLTIADLQLWSFTTPNAAPQKIWQGVEGDSIYSRGPYSADWIFRADGKAYFFIRGRDPVTSQTRMYLWVTGGTLETTQLLHSFASADFQFRLFANGILYFTDLFGGLWVTRGVPGSTQRILQGGFGNDIFESSTVSGNRVFFDGPSALWVTEGTPETTQVVYDFPDGLPSPSDLAELNGVVYFNASLTSQPGDFRTTLWRSDGTAEGTHTVFPSGDTFVLSPEALVRVEDRIYFRAGTNSTGLFATDGTAENTRRLATQLPLDTLERGQYVAIGSRLYFRNSSHGLSVTEGTEESTLQLTNDSTWHYAASNGMLFFQRVAGPAIPLGRWWRTDGTPEGTIPLTEPGQWSEYLTFATAGNLFFLKLWTGESTEGELWKSNGSPEGTSMVAAIQILDSSDRRPQWPLAASLHGNVYYGYRDLQYGYEPWRVRAPDGDTNFDGEIDLEDLNHVRNHFGYVGNDRPGDANGDGVVGLEDLNEVRNNFGGAPSPSATTRIEPARIPATAEVALSPQRRKTDAAKLDELLHTLAEDQLRDARPFGPLKRTALGAKSLLDGPKDAWDPN